MSNIYNKSLYFKIKPDGKRILERQVSTSYPRYAVEGNTKPNLDFKTNRMLQPLFSSKIPIQQNPFVPTQPVHAFGLGGRYPIDIDYITVPSKPRKPSGLIWEPNTTREMRYNVYPDGLPKNNIPAQSQDSQYLEYLNNEKKRAELEKMYNERGGNGPRPHPTREEELKKLENLIAETKYGRSAYKNIALNAEDHAKMAKKNADDIRAELTALKSSNRDNFDDFMYAAKNNLSSFSDVKTHKDLERVKQQAELEIPSKESLDFSWLFSGKFALTEEEGNALRKSMDYLQADFQGDLLESRNDEEKSALEDGIAIIEDLKNKKFSEYTEEEKALLRELIVPEEYRTSKEERASEKGKEFKLKPKISRKEKFLQKVERLKAETPEVKEEIPKTKLEKKQIKLMEKKSSVGARPALREELLSIVKRKGSEEISPKTSRRGSETESKEEPPEIKEKEPEMISMSYEPIPEIDFTTLDDTELQTLQEIYDTISTKDWQAKSNENKEYLRNAYKILTVDESGKSKVLPEEGSGFSISILKKDLIKKLEPLSRMSFEKPKKEKSPKAGSPKGESLLSSLTGGLFGK